jgi:hypothetical protein
MLKLRILRFTEINSCNLGSPNISIGFVLPNKERVCNRPKSPKQWSPWIWVMNIFIFLFIPNFDLINFICIPSPTSKIIISFPLTIAKEDNPLSQVGIAAEVPKNTNFNSTTCTAFLNLINDIGSQSG